MKAKKMVGTDSGWLYGEYVVWQGVVILQVMEVRPLQMQIQRYRAGKVRIRKR